MQDIYWLEISTNKRTRHPLGGATPRMVARDACPGVMIGLCARWCSPHISPKKVSSVLSTVTLGKAPTHTPSERRTRSRELPRVTVESTEETFLGDLWASLTSRINLSALLGTFATSPFRSRSSLRVVTRACSYLFLINIYLAPNLSLYYIMYIYSFCDCLFIIFKL